MIKRFIIRFVSVVVIASIASSGALLAADVEKKLRLGLSVGSFDAQGRIQTDSTNALFIVDQKGLLNDIIEDPREDKAAFGDLRLEPSYNLRATLSYNFTRKLGIQAGIAYQRGSVGQIEVQAQFNGVIIPQNQEFSFSVFRYEAGTITQIPLSLTAFARFRPDASLNPYIGVGVGYILNGFEPSSDLDTLSRNLDSSSGGLAAITGSFGTRSFEGAKSFRDLGPATISVPDSFEWHIDGGAEWSFNKRIAAFAELRYVFASRAMTIQFDGQDNLGIPVPNTIVDDASPLASATYGGIQFESGGLVDGGVIVPVDSTRPIEDCADPQVPCYFDTTQRDGQLDLGVYYAQGGSMKYGGWGLQLGVKITF